jgi:hypothetical protein
VPAPKYIVPAAEYIFDIVIHIRLLNFLQSEGETPVLLLNSREK